MPQSTSNNDPTLQRLDDQIRWYDMHSSRQRRAFYLLKVVTVVSAAIIPLVAAISSSGFLNKVVTSSLGALIVVIEGIQQLFQFQTNWILYRSTCESLKREKFLYLGNAGPYGAAQNRLSILAERIESLVSQELATWTSSQQLSHQGKTKEVSSKNPTEGDRRQDP